MTYCDREDGCIVCDRLLCDGKDSQKERKVMDYDCGRDYEYDKALKELAKAKKRRKDVISHLQIIHTWASFALEYDTNFFNYDHMMSIMKWTKDALKLLQKDGEMDDRQG